jgi:hypothetical protein
MLRRGKSSLTQVKVWNVSGAAQQFRRRRNGSGRIHRPTAGQGFGNRQGAMVTRMAKTRETGMRSLWLLSVAAALAATACNGRAGPRHTGQSPDRRQAAGQRGNELQRASALARDLADRIESSDAPAVRFSQDGTRNRCGAGEIGS